jgi:hypothetical protein
MRFGCLPSANRSRTIALRHKCPTTAGGHDSWLAFQEIEGRISAQLAIESFEPPVNYTQALQYEKQRYPTQNTDLERMYDRHALTPRP